MFMYYLFVFIGGFLGSISRNLVGNMIQPLSSGFPLQTFFINCIGSFFLGAFLPFAKIRLKPEYSLLIGTGFTGAFTTFSTFSLENVLLMNEKQFFVSFLYIFFSMFVGIFLSYSGYKLTDQFHKKEGASTS
ncbi:putative fluoride ion transporter CrcB 1 [Gottfriedia solisilvae]|uniref:Fluoride-specific ion channel FluC n=2 Tax=Gottfriedia solisilvae TaxID=1516104 RepID=A0A8J3AJB8_9BACI|nr:putative fluoride ion transporter CrcB 1 [Gottfriedia solisilvae]